MLLIAGCTADKGADTATPTASMEGAGAAASPVPESTPCRSTVTRDALPTWARGGFKNDGSGTPHVLSERGDLIAVLFEYPPVSRSDPQEGTKILWKSRLPQEPMQPLRIEATLAGTTTPVVREVPQGPGPSYVQLPRPGCWRLVLSWSGHQDRMTLQFS
ncbi:MAG: hypothetical protein WA890_16900 [Micromonospora sp.]